MAQDISRTRGIVNAGDGVLGDAVAYLWEESQKRGRTRQDVEDFSIALRLLGLLRDGWTGGPHLLDVAWGLNPNLSKKSIFALSAGSMSVMAIFQQLR